MAESSLKEQLNTAVKNAMREKDKTRLVTLRMAQAAVKQIEIDERRAQGPGHRWIRSPSVTSVQIYPKPTSSRVSSIPVNLSSDILNCKRSGLNHTIVRPGQLTNGEGADSFAKPERACIFTRGALN